MTIFVDEITQRLIQYRGMTRGFQLYAVTSRASLRLCRGGR